MFSLRISDENLKKLEEIERNFGKLEAKIVKNALSKAILVAKKEDKKAIIKRYTIDKSILNGKNLKTKTVNTEAILLGSTKKHRISSFDISQKTPGRNKGYISTHIVKPNPKFSWKTLFWAFWKNGNPRLMFRVGKERHKITLATTTNTKSMGLWLEEEVIWEKVQEIFTQELEKGIEEAWNG